MKKMVFQKYGKAPHLRISSAADFESVLALDEAHWVATGASTKTLHCDSGFLDLLDTDNNFRVMCFEVRNAIEWLQQTLVDQGGIDGASTTLKINAINGETKDGKSIRAAIAKMLRHAGKEDAQEITLAEVRAIRKVEEATPVSEAGVILPAASNDPVVQQCIKDIIEVTGGTPHPGGKPGLDEEDVDRFRAAATARVEWHAKVADCQPDQTTEILPLGPATHELYSIYQALREKLDDYFSQCEAVAFDKRTAEHFLPSPAKLQSADLTKKQSIDDILKASPVTAPIAEPTLHFNGQLNPLYLVSLRKFNAKIMTPLLGKSSDNLSKDGWGAIKNAFSPYEAWVNAEPGKELRKLGVEKIAQYMDAGIDKTMRELTTHSTKTAFVLDNIRLVEKLLLYQANMLSLLNTFVSFPDLYDPHKQALFEMGTMIVDGRHLNFSTKVEDINAHSKVAGESDIFVVYADVFPEDPKGKKFTVALPVTSGTKGNL
jgi:hypothetical protein